MAKFAKMREGPESVVPHVIPLTKLSVQDVHIQQTKRGATVSRDQGRILAILVEGVATTTLEAFDKRYLCIKIADDAALAINQLGAAIERDENARWWSPVADNVFKVRLSESTTIFDKDGESIAKVWPNTQIKCLVKCDRLWRLAIQKTPRFGLTYEVTQVVVLGSVAVPCLIVDDT